MARLPVLPPDRVARSRASRWRAVALVAIHLLIAAHITHWLVRGRTMTPVEPSEAMAFTKAGMINAGVIFFAVTILLTLVFGRFFCGWACHLVALQDLCRSLLLKLGIRPRPLRSRVLRWIPFLAFFYMFLWPIVYRLWIRDDFSRSGVELTTEHFWSTFPGWAVGLLTFAVCGFASVYFLGAKGFCTYACPYGAIFAGAERLSPMRIRVTDACAGCGHCTAVCSSNVRVHEEVRDHGMVVDSGCMKCLDCVSVCPNDALYYGFGPIPWAAKPRQTPRDRAPRFTATEEVVLALAFAAAFFTFRGLYGAVPFLLSLGLAGILALLGLTAFQLATRDHLSLRGRRLKRQGSLTTAGRVYLAIFSVLGLFWAHSAVVRGSQALGSHFYRQTAALRSAALDVIEEPRLPTAAEREAATRARDHFQRSQSWGLLPTPGLARKIAWTTFLVGPLDELQRNADLAIERGEYPAEMHETLGRDAWSRGEATTALEHYRQAARLEPGRSSLVLARGVIAAKSGDLTLAAEVLSGGVASFPQSTDILYNAGVVEALRNRPAEAADLFRRVLAVDPDRRDAMENLAGMLAASGRFDDSIEIYRRALVDAPEDPETRILLARVLLAAERWDEATAEIVEISRRVPGHPAVVALEEEIRSLRSRPLLD